MTGERDAQSQMPDPSDGPPADSVDNSDLSPVDLSPVDVADAPDTIATSTNRSSAWIAWTVAVTMAIVTAFAVVQMRSVTGPADDLNSARAAAAEYVALLSSWDASDGLDDTYLSLRDGAAASFRAELDAVFGEQTRAELVAVDAVSAGTVTGVFGDEVDLGLDGAPDTARVVVLVEQIVVTGPVADPAKQIERAAMVTLSRDGDRWLVTGLEMLSELEIADEEPA
jgi:hypothetical protein